MKNADKYNFDGYIYKPSDCGFTPTFANYKDVRYILQNAVTESDFKANAKGVKVCNLPFSFDIETTSFERENSGKTEKLASMYIWQFGINGFIIIGRNWFEFIELIKAIRMIRIIRIRQDNVPGFFPLKNEKNRPVNRNPGARRGT